MLSLENERPHEIIHYKFFKLRDIIEKHNSNIIVHGITDSGKTFLYKLLNETYIW